MSQSVEGGSRNVAKIKIGMVGLDTSHAVIFARLLNDSSHPDHIEGGQVTNAFPLSSPGLERSAGRVEKFTEEVRKLGVRITDSLEETVSACDAILLETVDGAQHLRQLMELLPHRKPIFVDKPLCLSYGDAIRMQEEAGKYGTPVMSASALRYMEGLREARSTFGKGRIIGADCFGPMELMEQQPGYFWYGIHTIEMLFAILGRGGKPSVVLANGESDLLAAVWDDGRFGTVRGSRNGNGDFGAVIHYEKGREFISTASMKKSLYANLVEEIILFFRQGKASVQLEETVEIIGFIEQANIKREQVLPG